MTLKQKLGTGIAGLGLAGAIFFGAEHGKDNDKLYELRQRKPYNKSLQEEYNRAITKGLVSGGLYTLSIATIYGGGTLLLWDKLKKDWGKSKNENK